MSQSTSGQWQRDASGADGELEDWTIAGEPGEEVHRLWLVAAGFLVVAFGDIGTEACERVEVLHGDSSSSQSQSVVCAR